jgi:DNA-binding HxlR family transcriptional regulator
MEGKPIEIYENCPVNRTLKLIGKKWTIEIISELVCGGERKRYNELLRSIPPITPKVLSQRLKQLEKNGVVRRTVYPDETPVRVEYELTKKGLDLEKVVNSMRTWGKKWSYKKYKDYCKFCEKWRKETA